VDQGIARRLLFSSLVIESALTFAVSEEGIAVHDLNEDFSAVDDQLPEDLKLCVAFHGHLCPGLVYGYLVAKGSMALLGIHRSQDEEVVAISENDTCAVDALQVLLGTTLGKGNLILKDYGKNVFTVFNRSNKRAIRMSRKTSYTYQGKHPEEFEELEAAYAAGRATDKQRRRQKWLKAFDLFAKPLEAVFEVLEVQCPEPPYAPLAPSKACARCGEMTMATKMVAKAGEDLCFPCSEGRPTQPQ
jgi:formylmethanofuran dehydrogenase subunit E